VFEHLKTPQEAYEFKLGAALNMERTVLDILDDSIEHAQDERVRQLLAQHRGETEQHVEVLEQVFGAFEWDIDDSPCPAIDGLKAEGKANLKKTDEAIIDSVILQGAAEVEHHEIGVYENLILNAKAMGRADVAELLQKNLQSEQTALQKAMTQQEQVAAVTPKQPVT
jgi:ferritin-like metal-binding protein YciE